MPNIGQNGTLSNAIAAQAIGDKALRLVLESMQQAFEEMLGGRPVPSALHQDIQHDAVLIHRTPQIMQHAIDADEHLIEVPRVSRPGSPAAQPPGKISPELPTPVSDALVSDDNPALGQDKLDIAQTEAEYVIQPDRVADDLSRPEAVNLAMPR